MSRTQNLLHMVLKSTFFKWSLAAGSKKQTDRQTDRQTERETDRQTERDGRTDGERDKQTDGERQTDRERDGRTDRERERDRQTDGERDGRTDRERDRLVSSDESLQSESESLLCVRSQTNCCWKNDSFSTTQHMNRVKRFSSVVTSFTSLNTRSSSRFISLFPLQVQTPASDDRVHRDRTYVHKGCCGLFLM